MKSTTNVFSGGLKTDYHPLTLDQLSLTDALNATLITYNGNEMMLLNDMGNTKILDSTTGNIMGLRDGFVPLGMKEHGGILYIASYNLKTKEGELGTIPSPVFNYTYSIIPDINNYTNPIMSGVSLNRTKSESKYIGNTLIDPVKKYNLYTENAFRLNDTRFRVGDKFLISLDIELINNKTVRKAWISDRIPDSLSDSINISFPQISQVEHFYSNSEYSGYGWFRLELLSKCARSEHVVKMDNIEAINGRYWESAETLDGFVKMSDYWFLHEDIRNIDVERSISNACYLTYPNIEPGYLYVKIEPELAHSFDLTESKATICVVFDSLLPDIPTIQPPEEGNDPTPPFEGDSNEVPDDPNIPDIPDPDNPELPPAEVLDDINPYLLPYDDTKFTEALANRRPGTRLRSPFRKYWNGTINRDADGKLIYNENITSASFEDSSIMYISANDVSTFVTLYAHVNGSVEDQLTLTNHYMIENQCNTLSFNPYDEYKTSFTTGDMSKLYLKNNGYDPSLYELKNVLFYDYYTYTNEIPNFNSLYTWGKLPTKTTEDGEVVNLVNSLYIYHDPDENNSGSVTQIINDTEAVNINDSTGLFGLSTLDTRLLYLMCRDLNKVTDLQMAILKESLQLDNIEAFGVTYGYEFPSGGLFTIPYLHEKAIVAIPANEGNPNKSEEQLEEYTLALVIFPHTDFPKFDINNVIYRTIDTYKSSPLITYNRDYILTAIGINTSDLILDPDTEVLIGQSTQDWFLDYDVLPSTVNSKIKSIKKSTPGISKPYPDEDITKVMIQLLSWYESDYMKKLRERDFILASTNSQSVYNIDNGQYIYNDGSPVLNTSDWDIHQACAVFPFVTKRYEPDLFGSDVNETWNLESTYVGYPEIEVHKDDSTYRYVVPYIKIKLDVDPDSIVYSKPTDLNPSSIINFTGPMVHGVQELNHETGQWKYRHNDFVIHSSESDTNWVITSGVKITHGKLLLWPVDDEYGEMIETFNPYHPLPSDWNSEEGADNSKLIRNTINEFLQNNNCCFYDEDTDSMVDVKIRYCRLHDETIY